MQESPKTEAAKITKQLPPQKDILKIIKINKARKDAELANRQLVNTVEGNNHYG